MKTKTIKHLKECKSRFIKDLEYLKSREREVEVDIVFNENNRKAYTDFDKIQANIKLKNKLLTIIDDKLLNTN